MRVFLYSPPEERVGAGVDQLVDYVDPMSTFRLCLSPRLCPRLTAEAETITIQNTYIFEIQDKRISCFFDSRKAEMALTCL